MTRYSIEADAITEFRGEHFLYSNFAPSLIMIDDIEYETMEHYYQSQKADNEEEREFVMSAKTPSEAKKRGRKVTLRPDWEEVKDGIMMKGLIAKFTQIEAYKRALLDTNDRYLAEGNTWNDLEWGIDLETGAGENKLGRMLMKIRAKLKKNVGKDNHG